MAARDMTQGRPARLIVTTALPLMLGSVFQQMYTVVDASVVGRGIGMEALAALGSSDWFVWLCLSLMQGFAFGFTIPLAQAFGARDYEGLRAAFGGAVALSVLIALAGTALSQALVQPVLGLLGTLPEVQPIAQAYLRALFIGLPVTMAYNLLAGTLRALGDSKSPLAAMVLSSLVNIALDLLFVMEFGLGVTGAAAATVIAQVCAALFCLIRVRSSGLLRVTRADLRPSRELSLRLLRLGLPVSLQNCVISVGGMIVQSVVNTMGVAFVAGYTATNKLYGLLELAAISYGNAISVFAGQNWGARRYARIRQGARAGCITGTLTALGIGALMFLFGRSIVSLFIDVSSAEAPRAVEYAVEFLRIMAGSLPILYILYALRSTLMGIGNTVMPMVSGLAEFVMRTGAALLLPARIGHSGLFWAEVLAWAGADVILLLAYLKTQRHLPKDGCAAQ